MSVTIISAAQGGGKTTFLREQVAKLKARGRSVGGIVSPAVFENEQRVGYDLIDLRNNERRPLARVIVTPGLSPTVGRYQFDKTAIAAGTDAIVASVRDRFDVIAIDEVGPWEFEGGGWAPALELALKECTPRQQLIVVVRPTLVNKLAVRFPSPLWSAATRISPPWPKAME
ncbi:MAG: DUF2478 domain-containing protein [Phycisphaerae bacterium]|nr:DUF2478 domain-containing protein [Phycisphaerae bacterium]